MNARPQPDSFDRALADEAAWEALRAECLDEFEDWVRADYDRREFEGFSNWLVRKASWNQPNRYRDALNWHERALLGMNRDAAILKLSKGLNRYRKDFGHG